MRHEVDPDAAGLDPATQNRGGNLLIDGAKNLHAEWDDIPASLKVATYKAAGVALAKQVPKTPGAIESWPVAGACDAMMASRAAFARLTSGAEDAAKKPWPVAEPAG